MNRRQAILQITGGIMLPSALLQACGGSEAGSGAEESGTRTLSELTPVEIDRDRILRTDICMRPYRPSGFRLEAEQVGDKLLIHNYGHGGGGFTLSWGTASLALDLLQQSGREKPTRAAVIGCGVIGLSTGLLLGRRGIDVTIYTRDLPPNTTSNLAGANFYPSQVIEDERLTPAFRRQLETACRISHAAFTELVDRPGYGVAWRPQFFLTDAWNEEIAAGTEIYQMLQDLYPDPKLFEPGEHPFKTRFAFREDSLFIEPPMYLAALVEDFRRTGGRIETRFIRRISELEELPEEVIFNCAGLGATALTTDSQLTALPGQQVIVQPQPDVDYAVIGDEGSYMFPRRDGVVLGYESTLDVDELLERQRQLVAEKR